MKQVCPPSPKRNQSLRIKQNTNVKGQEFDDLDEVAPKQSPQSPKRNIKGNMMKRDTTAKIDNIKQYDTLKNLDGDSSVLLTEESHFDDTKTKQLLKSPKRGMSLRIVKNDKGALIDSLSENIQLDKDEERDIDQFPSLSLNPPSSGRKGDASHRDIDNKSKGFSPSNCPPSPKKNIADKIKKMDCKSGGKSPLKEEKFNSLDDIDGILDDDKPETLIISPPDSPKKGSRVKQNIESTELIFKSDSFDPFEDNDYFHPKPVISKKPTQEKKVTTSQTSIDISKVPMPGSPKKSIKEKIKLKSETMIKEVNQISENDSDAGHSEVPKSPKKNASLRMKQKDAEQFSDMLDNNKRKLSRKKSEDENFFSLSEGRDEKSEDELMETKDYSSKYHSSKKLLDKIMLMEGKISTLEHELRVSRDQLNKKNNDVSKLTITNDQYNKDKQRLEATVQKLELQNTALFNETNTNRGKIKDLEQKYQNLKAASDLKINEMSSKLERILTFLEGNSTIQLTREFSRDSYLGTEKDEF